MKQHAPGIGQVRFELVASWLNGDVQAAVFASSSEVSPMKGAGQGWEAHAVC